MIRPDHVALLADVRIDFTTDPSTWSRKDGHALTKAEINRVLNTTIEEACATLRYARIVLDRYEDQAADIARADQLAAPYVAQLGPGAGVAEVLAAMPVGPEREEFAQLAEKIAFLDGTDSAG